jgi:hypothetical protein
MLCQYVRSSRPMRPERFLFFCNIWTTFPNFRNSIGQNYWAVLGATSYIASANSMGSSVIDRIPENVSRFWASDEGHIAPGTSVQADAVGSHISGADWPPDAVGSPISRAVSAHAVGSRISVSDSPADALGSPISLSDSDSGSSVVEVMASSRSAQPLLQSGRVTSSGIAPDNYSHSAPGGSSDSARERELLDLIASTGRPEVASGYSAADAVGSPISLLDSDSGNSVVEVRASSASRGPQPLSESGPVNLSGIVPGDHSDSAPGGGSSDSAREREQLLDLIASTGRPEVASGLPPVQIASGDVSGRVVRDRSRSTPRIDWWNRDNSSWSRSGSAGSMNSSDSGQFSVGASFRDSGQFSVGASFREALTRQTRRRSEWEVPFELPARPTARDCALALDHAADRVRGIVRLGRTFYIGISENPGRRFGEHLGANPSWSRMLVLTQADSSRETANLEMQLLRLFGSAMECANNSTGGERASAGSPHYLYVLVGISGLIRRSC